MKRILFILFILFLINIIHSQQKDIKLSSNGSDPFVAVDNNHNVHLAWSESGKPLQYAKFDTNGIMLINHIKLSYVNGANSPNIAINDTHMVIMWNQRYPTFNSYIEGQLLSTNSTFILNNIIYNEPYSDALRGGTQVTWLNDTSYIVLWVGEGYLTPVSGSGVYCRIVSISNNFLSPDLLLSDHGFEGVNHVTAKVVVNKVFQKIFVTWVDNYLGNYRVFGRFFNFSGEPLNDSFLLSDNDSSVDAWDLDCESDNNGDIVIVWGSGTLTEGEIKWRWIDFEGNFLTGVQTISSADYKNNSSVSVDFSINHVGNMILVWEDHRRGISEIYGQRFNSDRIKLGKSFKISSRENPYSQLYPKVDLHKDKIFTTWYEVDNIAEGVWLNITDFYNPLLDFRGAVEELTLDKKYVSPGIDSILITAKVNEQAGYVLFAEIEDENGIFIDSIYLFNDGLHGDSLSNDSVLANYYAPPQLLEQNYYINLHTALSSTDTISYKREKVEYFTTKGPITIDDIIFNENDTIPNPGEQIRFKISLKNNGIIESISDVKATIQTNNPNILLQNKLVQYGEILSETTIIPEKEFVLRIVSDFSGDKNIFFNLAIASKDTVFWSDNFTIYVDTLTALENEQSVIHEFRLFQNYPNPFNPSTTLSYYLPDASDVKLEIYNVMGEKIKSITKKLQTSGKHQVVWDGTNSNGVKTSSGIYIYMFEAVSLENSKRFVKSAKLMLVK